MKTAVFLALLTLAVPALGGETFRDCRECPEMVALPAGTFQMGETGRRNAVPVHAVALPAFAIGKYEVTQGEWKALMGANPSQNAACGDDCPVENVSWNDAREFARRLGAKTGKTYRLPSEAEWEYACRAGTVTPYHFGETLSADKANYNGNFVYGAGKKGAYREKTMPVGSFPGNPWGLHDMHGNVWQWCHDWHGGYSGKAVTDPQGPKTGKNRVLRGGSWGSHPIFCRSANRNFTDPDSRTEFNGFRVVLVVE